MRLSMASTTVDPTAVVLEVLNQFSNYKRWSLAVKNYLLAEDLWDVVADTTEPPKEGEPEFKTWRKNNARALRTIQNSCGTYHSNLISQVTSAKKAWEVLAEVFKPVFFEITARSSDASINGNTGHLSKDDDDGCLAVLYFYATDRLELAYDQYRQTPLDALKSRSGAELISHSFTRTDVAIPWDLIHRCPSLAVATDYFGHSPLNALAGTRSAFLSGRPIKFWEQWIYDIVFFTVLHVEHTLKPRPTSDEIRINIQNEENNQRNINRTGMGSLRQLATSLLKHWVSGHYNRIYQMKLIHVQSLSFLQFMCNEVIKNRNLGQVQLRFVQSAIFKAIERGHIEFITHILKANPGCAKMTDARGMNMFHFAVECRQEKVYSLIYGLDPRDRNELMGPIDILNNTPLHLVGQLTPYTQLDHIQDAALRMQRELQWFKEVEGMVPKLHGDLMNMTDNMTAHELFKKNHKELKKEGEKSMKGTATSCTVVGALIVTMMFGSAFQVPGGNNGETGIPVLIHQKHRRWFMVFIVADALSLCLSTTSVIIFLGILVSRYAEVDFLKSLPTKMIFGLVTLFLSITTMMIAFSSAIYIMLEEKSGTGIPIILLGGVPVITFVSMQFRLLREMVISTYGAGIFQKKVQAWRLNPDDM